MIPQSKPSRQQIRQQQRSEQKAEKQFEKLEKRTTRKVKTLLHTVFSVDRIDEIATRTYLCERNRTLTPLVIVSILMIGCFHDVYSNPIPSLERLCLILRKRFDVSIKPQSLQEKINRPETVNFIKAVTEEVMKHEGNKVIGKILKKRKLNIPLFSRILIEDSTVFSLPESLQRIFRGCGGAASKAAVKWNLVVDQCRNQVISFKMVAGRVPDSNLSGDIINILEKDDLIIRDLGYFNLSQFSKIIEKNAYFISRLSHMPNVYLNKDDEESIDLIQHLIKLGINKKDIDIQIYLGKHERIPLRLIAIKVPPEVLEQRRQKYKRKYKKEPSEYLKEWNGYTFMVTNIPKNQLSLKMIQMIYKIRWQIELIFKNMKSNICVDKLTGNNKHRILIFIYMKMLISWTVLLIYAYGQALIGMDGEISLFKLTMWLKDESKLIKAFIYGTFLELLEELKQDLDSLCMKGKGRRRSTSKEIENEYNNDFNLKAA